MLAAVAASTAAGALVVPRGSSALPVGTPRVTAFASATLGGLLGTGIGDAARQARDSVVGVRAAAARNPRLEAISIGSGVIIGAGGYVDTRHRVVKGADTITVRLCDGRELPASVAEDDSPFSDIAVLRGSDKPVDRGDPCPRAVANVIPERAATFEVERGGRRVVLRVPPEEW